MGDWGRNRGGYRNSYNYQSGSKFSSRSHYRKPQQQEYWKPPVPPWVNSIPSWERAFITDVGRISWGRFVHCQKSVELYSDVLEWDDSEGKDAFYTAKKRFWAGINGQPCDIPLPDPYMYVDEIDWNAWTDPELYKDLENTSVTLPDEEERDGKMGLGGNSFHYMDQPIVPTGWGDEEFNMQGGGNEVNMKDNPSWDSPSWQGPSWVNSCLKSLMKPIIPLGCDNGENDPRKTACYQSQNSSLRNGGNMTNERNISWDGNGGGSEGASWGVHGRNFQDHGKDSIDNDYWDGNNGGGQGGASWGSHYASLHDGDKKVSGWEGNNGRWGGGSTGWHNYANDKNNSWDLKNGGWEGRSTGWHDKANDGGLEAPQWGSHNMVNDKINSWECNKGGWEGVPWGSHDRANDTSNSQERKHADWEDSAWGLHDEVNNKNNSWEGKNGGSVRTPSGSHDQSRDKNGSWEGNNGDWGGPAGYSSSLIKNTPIASENTSCRNSESWRRGSENWRKRESESQQLSRYKTTRYQGEDYRADHGWRNNRGKKRVSFANNQSPMEPLAQRQWNSIHTCGPTSHHKPDKGGNSWSWEKQVS